jgi:hypothetical protein
MSPLLATNFSQLFKNSTYVYTSHHILLLQLNPEHTLKFCVFETHCDIISHLRLDITICLFTLGFPNKTSYVF